MDINVRFNIIEDYYYCSVLRRIKNILNTTNICIHIKCSIYDIQESDKVLHQMILFISIYILNS